MSDSKPRRVILAVGLPASGKTTFLKPHAIEIGATYICPDEIRESLAGDAADQSRNDDVWKIVRERVRKGLAVGPVIVDGIGVFPDYRRQDVALYKRWADEVVAYVFDTPFEECLERNRRRERRVPDEAMQEMNRLLTLHPPSTDEGLDRILPIQNQD